MTQARRFDYNRAIDDECSFHGWRLDALIEQAVLGPDEKVATIWPMRPRDRDYNALMDSPIGPVVVDFLTEATHGNCDSCASDCIHNAARSLLGLVRVVEHPPNCPECARIHAERQANREHGT